MSIVCQRCGRTVNPEVEDVKRPIPATTYDACYYKCECGVAYSNSTSEKKRTYIWQDPLNNIIIGHDMIRNLLEGKTGKAETRRLGHENSEDALSWNVFRSLQKAEHLRTVVDALFEIDCQAEPELYMWGSRVDQDSWSHWEELAQIRQSFEPTHRQQTEPDICLHLPGKWWILIEAKFGSPTSMRKTNAPRLNEWLDRYDSERRLFDRNKLESETDVFPEQIFRNIAFADALCKGRNEKPYVVGLVRKKDENGLEEHVSRIMCQDSPVHFSSATWESIFHALPPCKGTERLRDYMSKKTHTLTPAFDL